MLPISSDGFRPPGTPNDPYGPLWTPLEPGPGMARMGPGARRLKNIDPQVFSIYSVEPNPETVAKSQRLRALVPRISPSDEVDEMLLYAKGVQELWLVYKYFGGWCQGPGPRPGVGVLVSLSLSKHRSGLIPGNTDQVCPSSPKVLLKG